MVASERQVSDLKAEKRCPDQEAEPEAHAESLLSLSKNIGKKLGSPSAVIPTGMLGTSLEVDQRLIFWLEGEVRELCPDGVTLSRNWQNRNRQCQQHAIQAQHPGPVLSLRSLALFSRAKHYTLVLL